VKGKCQEVKEWIGNVRGKDKVSGEQETKEHSDFCLGLALHMHGGVNGGVSGQEGVEVWLAGGKGCLGGHLIIPLISYRHFKQSSKRGLACNDDA
jgi:hypothetical protein